MKILTAEQMRGIDRRTVESAGITYRQLMENAGRQVAEFLHRELLSFPTDPAVHRLSILCGKGNNGGDALVAARYLREMGYRPRVFLLAAAEDLKGDAGANYEAYQNARGTIAVAATEEDWAQHREQALDCEVLVDGLLGTGLSGPAKGHLARVIADVNAAAARFRVLAVDIPSGLPSESGEPVGPAMQADATVTFTAPKRGQIFPPNSSRVGTLAVAPIGTPPEILAEDPELFLNLIVPRQFKGLRLRRDPTAHKGHFGHVLLLAGSLGKSGAAALGGQAALRAGAGLVTVATAASAQPVVASHAPEIMTEPLPETDPGTISTRALDYGHLAKLAEDKSVLAMGPGLTTHPETVHLVRTVVEQFDLPLLLDADGLNALVGGVDVLRRRRSRLVALTPHPGEMARLLGTTSAEVQSQRVEVAQNFAREFGVFVILKGYRTLVASPEGQVNVNPTGNPGLATGGSGDVLTGVLAGVLGQWPEAAAADVLSLGVYLHGLAGDVAARELGEQAMIASDILEALPRAWGLLREKIEGDDPGSYYIVSG